MMPEIPALQGHKVSGEECKTSVGKRRSSHAVSKIVPGESTDKWERKIRENECLADFAEGDAFR
jgi:hypothetical protein